MTASVASLGGKSRSIQLYLDVSAQHVVDDCESEAVQWASWRPSDARGSMRGVQLGSAAQRVLGAQCDRCNIDWGWLHLAVNGTARQRVRTRRASTLASALSGPRSPPLSPRADAYTCVARSSSLRAGRIVGVGGLGHTQPPGLPSLGQAAIRG